MSQSSGRNRPYELKSLEGWKYRFGVEFIVKASEIQEGSGAAILEYVTKKGEEPGFHSHPTEDEMFYVLEGSVTFYCGNDTYELEKGGFIFLPRGTEHNYLIQSDNPVHFLVITSPVRDGIMGGWGGFIADLETSQGEVIEKPESEGKSGLAA